MIAAGPISCILNKSMYDAFSFASSYAFFRLERAVVAVLMVALDTIDVANPQPFVEKPHKY